MSIWKTLKEVCRVTKVGLSELNNGLEVINATLEKHNNLLECSMPFRKAKQSVKLLIFSIETLQSFVPLEAKFTKQTFFEQREICNELVIYLDKILESKCFTLISSTLLQQIEMLNEQFEQEIFLHFPYENIRKLGYNGDESIIGVFSYICEKNELIQAYETYNQRYQNKTLKKLRAISECIK